MKNVMKFISVICFFFFATEGNAQIVASGTGVWDNFNLATPAGPGPWPFANYVVPAAQTGWETPGFVPGAGWLNSTNTNAFMWVDESGGQVHGALFRTNFNLTAVSGSFRIRVRPNNECEVFINGTQVGGLFNWTNNIVEVCVPINLLQVGNNLVAIQTTEWLDNSTQIFFELWNDSATGPPITPANATYCAGDPSFTYPSGAGGTWSGNGITAAGVFTPSTSNLGANTLTYTDNSGACPTIQTVVANVEDCCVDTCYWTLLGNSNVQANNFIGPKNSADFKIRTDNIERMTVEANGNVGINNTAPANKLEVTHGTAGNSGLRFTDLPNTAAAITNPTNKVLSVDASGDVILVTGGGGGGAVSADQGVTLDGASTVVLGDDCGNDGGRFNSDREINMNHRNLYFHSGRDGESRGKLYMGGEDCKELHTRLEISSAGLPASNSYASPDPSLSGLRFTDLTSDHPPIPNQTEGVLSLDRDGDVIWVQTCCSSGKMESTGDSQRALILRLEEQEAQIAELRKMIEELKANAVQIDQTRLSDPSEIILEQNVPNPFTDFTSIGYVLPERIEKAQIIFTTLEGKTVKTVDIAGSGRGVLRVYNDELSNGIYTYSLIVDGQVIDSKKMNLNY